MKNEGALVSRFSRHGGIFHADEKTFTCQIWAGPPPPAGQPRTQTGSHAGRNVIPPSYAMSSDRLFLDRVGRHQSPSPLHRRAQTTTSLSQPTQNRTFLLCRE